MVSARAASACEPPDSYSGALQPAAPTADVASLRVRLEVQEYTWDAWADASTWPDAYIPLHFGWDMTPYTWEQHVSYYGHRVADQKKLKS